MRTTALRRALPGLAASVLVVGTLLGTASCGDDGAQPAGEADSDAASEEAPVVTGDVVAVGVAYDDGRLVVLAPETGEVLWEADEVEGGDLVSVLGFGGTGIVVDLEGMVAFETGTGVVTWTVEPDDVDHVVPAQQSVLVYDGDVVTALEASTGDQRWSYDAPDSQGIAVSTDGARVVVAGDDDLILLDAETGDEVWRGTEYWPRPLGNYNVGDDEEFGAASQQGVAGTGPQVQLAYADDAVVVTSIEGADLLAADASTGGVLWTKEDSDQARYGVLGWEESVVSVGRDGVAAWDKTTGEPLWELELDFAERSGDDDDDVPALVQHGQVLVVADPAVGLVAVDLADGTRAWQQTMDDLTSLSVAGDLVVAVIDGVPTALDPMTGEVRWTGEPGEDTELVVLRDTAGGVVVDPESGNGLDLGTGEVLWTLEDE